MLSTCWPSECAGQTANGRATGQHITAMPLESDSHHFESHPSLPRHKAILTALLNRDPLGARQATFVLLKETSEDLSIILDSGIDLM